MSGSSWRRALRFFRPDLKQDVDDELTFHLEMRVRELIDRGLAPEAARAAAERRFGAVGEVRASCLEIDERRSRRSNRREAWTDLRQDVIVGARVLRRSPGFTLAAIALVALGVSTTTTIFSAVQGILIRPLPYPAASELVSVYERRRGWPGGGLNISYPDWVGWRDQNRTFGKIGIWTWTSHALSGDGAAERVEGAAMSAEALAALGVAPALGRLIGPADQVAGQHHVILLSSGLWKRRFGADRGIVGRTINVDAVPTTVIGVMPPGFNFPDRQEVWVPFVPEPNEAPGNKGYAGAIGRLKPGITFEAAKLDLATISVRLEKAFPDNHLWEADPRPLRQDLTGDLRQPLLVFLGAVASLLVIACTNVASLMLARSVARGHEIAIRTALGANRSRVIRQMLTESVLLAVLGGLVGVALTPIGVKLLRTAFPANLPDYVHFDANVLVLLFGIVLSVVAGSVFGLVPALRVSRVDVRSAMQDGGKGASAGRDRGRLRNAMVVAEVALSAMLLVGGGLLIRSYRALSGTELGFDERGLLSMRVSLPQAKYETQDRRRVFFEQLIERVRAIPGVEAVGGAQGVPFSGWNTQSDMSIEGRPARSRGEELEVHYQWITPDYFKAIGVPIVKGRGLTPAERDSTVWNGVINEILAKQEFPNEDPIGKRIKWGGVDSHEPWITIVGVAKAFRHYRLPQPMGPAIYLPTLADPPLSQTLAIRTSLADPRTLLPAINGVLHEADPDVPAYSVQTFEELVARALWRQRLQGNLLGVFAAVALVLAAIGLYGVISYGVTQQRREIGVRLALGASRAVVLRSVIARGLRLALLGTGLGLLLALAATRWIAGLLYGITPMDPVSFVGAPLLLGLAALAASYLPARAAAGVDPSVAMRGE